MKNILVGTKSNSKIEILKNCLGDLQYNLFPYDVESGISDQPMSEQVTIQGATNRAENAIKHHRGEFDISLGMEAGLELISIGLTGLSK